MRAHGTRAERPGDQTKGRRAETKSPLAQRMLSLQRQAGNSGVARAVEQERHEHGVSCGYEQPSADQPLAEEPPAAPRSADQRSV